MSSEWKTVVAGSAEPHLPVLRFGLKQLFWGVTGLCFLFVAMVAAPAGIAAAALLLAVSVVVLHVLSTAIGTRLGQHADQLRTWESGREPGERQVAESSGTASIEPHSRSPLHGHDQPLARMRLCLTIGAALGGLLGVVVLSIAIGDRTTVPGILVGAASTAVLGGWIAFVSASAWSIFHRGWRDAVAHDRRE